LLTLRTEIAGGADGTLGPGSAERSVLTIALTAGTVATVGSESG